MEISLNILLNSLLEKKDLSVENILNIYPFLGVPHFQRGLVWGDDSISSLLESLYYETPCGSIILWKPKNSISEEGIPLPLPEKFQSPDCRFLIVDGQQRIRSLFNAFYNWGEAGDESNNLISPEYNKTTKKKEKKIWCINLEEINELKDYLSYRGKKFSLFLRVIDPHNADERSPFKTNCIPLHLFFNDNISDLKSNINLWNYFEQFATLNPNKNSSKENVFELLTQPIIKNISVIDKIIGIKKQRLFLITITDKELSEVIQLYNRVNSGGKKVEAEEKAFANLISFYPKTNQKITELYSLIHAKEYDEANNKSQIRKLERDDYLKRQKEKNFGFKQFIRIFIQICNYHFGLIKNYNTFSFSVLENDRFQRLISKENIAEIMWEKTKVITNFLAGNEGIIKKDLFCDDLRFLPETRSLYPIIQLLVQYPKLISEQYKAVTKYFCLIIYLKEYNERQSLNLVFKIFKSIDYDQSINHLINEIDIKDFGKFRKYLYKRLEDSNTLQDRYILLLYWLIRKNGTRDFSYENLDPKIRHQSMIPGQEKDINQNENPEKQHISPYSLLEDIYEDLAGKRRMSDHEANNIGNITYISSILNSYETGLGSKLIKLEIENKKNLKNHYLLNENEIDHYDFSIYLITQNLFENLANEKYRVNKSDIIKRNFENFCKYRRELISNGFIDWLTKLNNEQLTLLKSIEIERPLFDETAELFNKLKPDFSTVIPKIHNYLISKGARFTIEKHYWKYKWKFDEKRRNINDIIAIETEELIEGKIKCKFSKINRFCTAFNLNTEEFIKSLEKHFYLTEKKGKHYIFLNSADKSVDLFIEIIKNI